MQSILERINVMKYKLRMANNCMIANNCYSTNLTNKCFV